MVGLRLALVIGLVACACGPEGGDGSSADADAGSGSADADSSGAEAGPGSGASADGEGSSASGTSGTSDGSASVDTTASTTASTSRGDGGGGCYGECTEGQCCQETTEAGELVFECTDGMFLGPLGGFECPPEPPEDGTSCHCGHLLDVAPCPYWGECPTSGFQASCIDGVWSVAPTDCPICDDAPCDQGEICLSSIGVEAKTCVPDPCEGTEPSCECAEAACAAMGCTCNSVWMQSVTCSC